MTAMTIGTDSFVMIGSQGYYTYISESDAEAYMLGAFHAHPIWDNQSITAKNQAIITASRVLDRQRWKGTQTDPNEPLQWPRTGTGIAAVDANPTVIPAKICDACAEMALALVQGSDLQNVQNQSQKTQSLTAGSVSVSYFRLAEGLPVRWPQIIQELLRDYLLGNIANVQIAKGTHGRSVTQDTFGLTRGM